MIKYPKIVCLLLFIIEIVGLIIYIININKSNENQAELFEAINNTIINTKEDRKKFYYYLSEFKRILLYNDKDNIDGRSTLSKIVTHLYIPTFILIIVSCLVFSAEYYNYSFYIFLICGLLTLCSFIDSLFYPYKVDIPGKDIYIFDDILNDKIKKALNEKINIKEYIVGSTIVVILAIIAHIIICKYLDIIVSKDNDEESRILNSLVKKENDKENEDDKNIIEPILK
jgi:hypothetical protein